MTAPGQPVSVDVLGRTIEISATDVQDRNLVAAIVRGFRPAAPNQDVHARYHVRRTVGGWTVERDGAITHRAATIADALLALEWQLVSDLLAIPLGRFHLHGAALADPSGTMTALVCGESGAGKTTLAMALMSAGFLPYSDDVVLIDVEQLTPVTFERAFHVDSNTRRMVAELEPDPEWEDAGLPEGYFLPRRWARDPLPVGALFFPRGRGVEKPLLVKLAVADAATALLGASGSLDSDPALALRAAARLTAAAPAFALYSGALADTLDLVRATIDRLTSER